MATDDVQATTMDLNPRDLDTADIDLDEKNVERLQLIMGGPNGEVLPNIQVWCNGNRIIDGFHRVEAAKRLGRPTIKANVVICDEATFWDSRIACSRIHHSVAKPRLDKWMEEYWKRSIWYETLRQEESDDWLGDMFDAMWSLERYRYQDGMSYHPAYKRYKDWSNFTKSLKIDQKLLLEWFLDLAFKWDMNWDDLLLHFFTKVADVREDIRKHRALNFVGAQLDWDSTERTKASQYVGSGSGSRSISALYRFFQERTEDERYSDWSRRTSRPKHEDALRKRVQEEFDQAVQDAERYGVELTDDLDTSLKIWEAITAANPVRGQDTLNEPRRSLLIDPGVMDTARDLHRYGYSPNAASPPPIPSPSIQDGAQSPYEHDKTEEGVTATFLAAKTFMECVSRYEFSLGQHDGAFDSLMDVARFALVKCKAIWPSRYTEMVRSIDLDERWAVLLDKLPDVMALSEVQLPND